MYQTHRRWWTVADAARLLRVHVETLYDAVRADEFPHERWEGLIRIPCEALRMTYVPTPEVLAQQRRSAAMSDNLGDPDQLALPLDPSCLVPVRRYRNTRELIGPWEYERKKYGY